MISIPNKVKNTLIVIVGPTAVGKTKITVELARHFNSIVLNADSRQVYREMSIGTAKPPKDDMAGIKHYFVGSHGLDSPINAGIFEKESLSILQNEFPKNNPIFLSGGSGLYIQAVCHGFDELPAIDPQIRINLNDALSADGLSALYKDLQTLDPEYASIVDRKNPQRVIRALEIIKATGNTYSSYRKKETGKRPFSIIKIGLNTDKDLLKKRINERMDRMIEQGLFEEAKLLKSYSHLNPLQTVGYREIFGFLDNDYDYDEAVRLLKRNSRRYAKRQLTWFRKDKEVQWFEPPQVSSIIRYINERLYAQDFNQA